MHNAVGHPLDPLTPAEIKAAAAAIKATAAGKDLSPLRFNVITLAVCLLSLLIRDCGLFLNKRALDGGSLINYQTHARCDAIY